MTMRTTMRIELTPEEREELKIVAFEFELSSSGELQITEIWTGWQGDYWDRVSIRIPPRVWALAGPWIASESASRAK